MGKASWNEKLTVVFFGQFHSDIFPKGRRTFAKVYGNIINSSTHNSHELGLGMFAFLEMQTAKHPVLRATFVVLNEIYVSHEGIEIPLVVALENFRFQNQHAFDIGFYNIHVLCVVLLCLVGTTQQIFAVFVFAHGLSHFAQCVSINPAVGKGYVFKTCHLESATFLYYLNESGSL